MSNIFTKAPHESKTIVAAVVTLLASILGFLGINLTPEDQAVIVASITSLITAVGAIVAIYGRVTAHKAISR